MGETSPSVQEMDKEDVTGLMANLNPECVARVDDSVRDSVQGSSVRNSARDSIQESVQETVKTSVVAESGEASEDIYGVVVDCMVAFEPEPRTAEIAVALNHEWRESALKDGRRGGLSNGGEMEETGKKIPKTNTPESGPRVVEARVKNQKSVPKVGDEP